MHNWILWMVIGSCFSTYRKPSSHQSPGMPHCFNHSVLTLLFVWCIVFFFFLSIELAIEIILLISDSILPFYEQTVHVLRHQWEYSCEKAKTELGYNPRGLEDGLKEVLPWLKSMGVIKYWGKMLVVTCVVALHGWDVN